MPNIIGHRLKTVREPITKHTGKLVHIITPSGKNIGNLKNIIFVVSCLKLTICENLSLANLKRHVVKGNL